MKEQRLAHFVRLALNYDIGDFTSSCEIIVVELVSRTKASVRVAVTVMSFIRLDCSSLALF